MNCQECRNLFDDMLDRRMMEPLKRRMLNHLANCPECSASLKRRRKAHASLFRALNHFDGLEHLSGDFADRLVAECRRPQSWWQNVAMPKWALVAASIAIMAGFVFAATAVVDAVMGKGGDGDDNQQSIAIHQHEGENEMNIKQKAVAAFTATLLSGGTYAADYTWMASPADANWNTSSLNWNSGDAWEDNASAPNNAVFPSASSQKAITIPSGQTRLVNNLDIRGAYTIQGDGKLDLAGTFSVNNDCTFNAAFNCQTVRFAGTSGKILKFDTKSTGSLQTATYIDAQILLNLYGDKSFGPQPTEPTDNIFITSGNPRFLAWVPWNTTLNQNRTIRISPNAGLGLGGNSNPDYAMTIKSLIRADNSPGLEFSTNTVVLVPADWTGLRVLDPGQGRTNIVGRLRVESLLKIASGITRLGSAKVETGAYSMLYISGNGSGYSSTRGNLEIAGGTLYASQSRYVDVSNYGQVTVKDGGKVYMPNVTWLNGLSGRGKLTVANGEFTVSTLRINQSSYSEVHLEEGGLIAANVLQIEPGATPQGLFRFNGGRLQARDGTARGIDFLTSAPESKWGKVKFGVGEGGAVFDTDNGQNIWWRRPLMSDAEHDGGVKKIGGGLLVFTNTNCYNGVTHVVSGGVQLRTDNALPPGSTLRLGGGANPYIDAWTFENAGPARATEQWLSRVEGTGSINNCTKLHVTNSIVPAVDGALSFGANCDMRGDLVISGDANGCGCLKIAAGQDISGLALKVPDISTFNKDAQRSTYKILDAPGGYTGEKFAADNLVGMWYVKYTSTGAFITRRDGLVISIR